MEAISVGEKSAAARMWGCVDPMLRIGLAGPRFEVGEDPAHHVAQVDGALFEIRILHLSHHLDRCIDDLVEGGLDIDLLLADLLEDLVEHDLVLEHEEMEIEDVGVVPGRDANLVLQGNDLTAGLRQRGIEPGMLARNVGGPDGIRLRLDQRVVTHHHASTDDPG